MIAKSAIIGKPNHESLLSELHVFFMSSRQTIIKKYDFIHNTLSYYLFMVL